MAWLDLTCDVRDADGSEDDLELADCSLLGRITNITSRSFVIVRFTGHAAHIIHPDHRSAFVPLPDALRPSMRTGPAGTTPAGLRSPHVTSLVSGHETHPGAAPGTAPAHTTRHDIVTNASTTPIRVIR